MDILFNYDNEETTTCHKCGGKVLKKTQEAYFSFVIQETTSHVNEIIGPYFEHRNNDFFTCSLCKERHQDGFTVKNELTTVPNVLVFSLQRQFYDRILQIRKIRDQIIKFDFSIDLLKNHTNLENVTD
jgi:hypothetical protein